jgi:hypothetical protein
VDRYQRNNPLAPHVGASNAKELVFDKLDSSYAVATAGTKEGGRGGTVSHFHGSEVAFWANAPAHFAASVQGVPLLPGTEVILESTSAGAAGEFYERWLDAEAGRGDYIPIFLPWWLSKEYSRDPEAGFQLLQEPKWTGKCRNRNMPTLGSWACRKCAGAATRLLSCAACSSFSANIRRTPVGGLDRAAGHGAVHPRLLVVRARKRKGEGVGPLILGVDPASNGGDRFASPRAAETRSCGSISQQN